MEIPVVASASTQSLRSAVGTCTNSSNPYMNSSSYSGGCFKKIVNNVKKRDGASFLCDINFSKKRKSASECVILCKRNKSPSCDSKSKNGKVEAGTREIANKYAEGVLIGFSGNGLAVSGAEYLTNIKADDFFEEKPRGIFTETFGGNGSIQEENPAITANDRRASSSTVDVITSGTSRSGSNDDNNNPNTENDNFKRISISDVAVNANIQNISISEVRGESPECRSGCVNVNGEEGKGESSCGLTWQPSHSVTRRTALISREVLRVWQARFGSSSYLNAGQVALLLKDLQALPSNSQVHKNLESTGRGISFEEFCRLLAESESLKFSDIGLSGTSPAPRKFGKNGSHQQIRRSRKLSKTMCKYDVFLGGSCNPTTWRTDIAIPDLKKMGITYFNPVSQWRPDLLEVEYHAKENAAVMFFVIDNQTRGVSALIEAAHIAGSKRNLILVIQSYTQEKQTICGEIISQEECEDLRNGQRVLRELVQSQGIPVFEDIHLALKCTERLLRKNEELESDDERQFASPRKIDIREAFDALKSAENGRLSSQDACIALRLSSQCWSPPPPQLPESLGISGVDESTPSVERTVNFEESSTLAPALPTVSGTEGTLSELSRCLSPSTAKQEHAVHMRDVFLGGTLKATSWREDVAEPLLKKNGLSYFSPKASEGKDEFLPVDAAIMKNSYVLLFVITSDARSIAEMAVAGHFIGLGARTVLCIEHFPAEARVGLEKLTENAIKDYNRGRMYLADIARRNNVKVFSDVNEAVLCVIRECQLRQK